MVGTSRALMTAMFVVALAGCGGSTSSGASTAASPSAAVSPSASTKSSVVYAAVGASETVGIGSTNPSKDAWPTVFAGSALPPGATYRNYGISGETVAGAITDEVPKALIIKPTLVTVWLNVNDLNAGVSVADYQAQLTQLVHAMRQGGTARVLVANTPWLDRLPLYLACLSGSAQFQCPQSVRSLTAAKINAAVDAYNVAIAAVIKQEGAELVDLHAQGEVPVDHPEYVGTDGFHPSTLGHAAVAGAFLSRFQQPAGG
ncbi:MAG: SGNH/GDSL hydrolase family protein [Candidatus Dormibacteria bacterium]